MRTLRRDNLRQGRVQRRVVPARRHARRAGQAFRSWSALDMGGFSVAGPLRGSGAALLDLALPYAGERRAFGRPIGDSSWSQSSPT